MKCDVHYKQYVCAWSLLSKRAAFRKRQELAMTSWTWKFITYSYVMHKYIWIGMGITIRTSGPCDTRIIMASFTEPLFGLIRI